MALFGPKFSMKNEDFLRSLMKWTPTYVPISNLPFCGMAAPGLKCQNPSKVDTIAMQFINKNGLGSGDGYVRPGKRHRVEDNYYNPTEQMPVDGNIMHNDAVTIGGLGDVAKPSPIMVAGLVILVMLVLGFFSRKD